MIDNDIVRNDIRNRNIPMVFNRQDEYYPSPWIVSMQVND